MDILFLVGDEKDSKLTDHLRLKHTVCYTSELIDEGLETWDLVLAYGYRHILSQEQLALCKRPPINLHISLLPYNKCADPNFWAWYEETPHGVSIHHIDSGVDTGDIIVQKELSFKEGTTLSKSYYKLKEELEDLFVINSDKILSYSYIPQRQIGNGTFHYAKELPKFEGGWNQTIVEIVNLINEHTDRQEYLLSIVDGIETARKRNNVNWMELLRIAIKSNQRDTLKVLRQINQADGAISTLFKGFR